MTALWIVLGIVVLLGIIMFVRLLPDIRRYAKMRSM